MPASHLTAKKTIKFHEGGATWQHRELHGVAMAGQRHHVSWTHARQHQATSMEVGDGLARRHSAQMKCFPCQFCVKSGPRGKAKTVRSSSTVISALRVVSDQDV